ncbi:c-type cytochrome [Parasphingorhabdus sp.]|jgi:mono/diheme cytochrome c family protein|uniref:c-type cytochrome n=1 Tax=Parasphingorhabdus sp. TaxID=2709688 RepID=UPI003001E248
MRLLFLGVILPLIVTGCATVPAKPTVVTVDSSGPRSDSDSAVEGLAFAQARCAGCHNVAGGQASPNSLAPRFEAIANTRGLTSDTLKAWLRDSHNYPGQMDFEIDAKRIDELAAYMLTLKSPAYRPPIQ